MIGILRGESTTSRCVGINVEVNRRTALLMMRMMSSVVSRQRLNQSRNFFNSWERVKEPLAGHYFKVLSILLKRVGIEDRPGIRRAVCPARYGDCVT